MYYSRSLDLAVLIEKNSFFLFGPRATGKSTLIHAQLPSAYVFDLLDVEVFGRLLRQPKLIGQLSAQYRLIVIDEIQKIPTLLDEVQRLMEEKPQLRFLLTGSSARKLKHGSANLLGGRAWVASLFPLIAREIPDFSLETYLNTGGLPKIYNMPDVVEHLDAYVNLYLREEILAEGLTRNLVGFARFLDVMGLTSGEELCFQAIASDSGNQARTVQNYVQILEDTLLGFQVTPFLGTRKRKAITRTKFYLFDVGVANFLAKRFDIRVGSDAFGRAFEHFIACELRAAIAYQRRRIELSYWRSTSGYEVDFIVGNAWAIEVKSTGHVQEKHLKGLRVLKEEGKIRRYALVSLDPIERSTEDGVMLFPYKKFLDLLWAPANVFFH